MVLGSVHITASDRPWDFTTTVFLKRAVVVFCWDNNCTGTPSAVTLPSCTLFQFNADTWFCPFSLSREPTTLLVEGRSLFDKNVLRYEASSPAAKSPFDDLMTQLEQLRLQPYTGDQSPILGYFLVMNDDFEMRLLGQENDDYFPALATHFVYPAANADRDLIIIRCDSIRIPEKVCETSRGHFPEQLCHYTKDGTQLSVVAFPNKFENEEFITNGTPYVVEYRHKIIYPDTTLERQREGPDDYKRDIKE